MDAFYYITRVHPESYELARKMAAYTMKNIDDKDAERTGTVEEILEMPQYLDKVLIINLLNERNLAF